MSKTYLATFCIDGSRKRVSSPPIKECTFLIPTLSSSGSDIEDDFENVTISVSGEISFEPKYHNRESPCLLTTVPIVYPSLNQCAMFGDMEMEIVASINNFDVWKTKPYPSEPACVVLLSGSLLMTSGGILIDLPPECAPSQDLLFPDKYGILTVRSTGIVEFLPDQEGTESLVSLDNIRYPLHCTSNAVHACGPHRSHILVNGPMFAKQSDLFFSIISRDRRKSVAIVTTRGELVFIDQEEKGDVPILVSSVFASSQSGTSTCIKQLIAEQMVHGESELVSAVSARLSAVVFARLLGESESKCIRRDRGWRQTGVRNAPFQSRT